MKRDNRPIPRDLIEHAIAEINREIPPKDELLAILGDSAERITSFLDRISTINFLANEGIPIAAKSDSWVQVASWEEAQKLLNVTRSMIEDQWQNKLKALIEQHNLGHVDAAAFDLYNEYWNVEIPEKIRWAVVYEIEGSLKEIILEPIKNISFFRTRFDIYELGHWPVTVDDEGKIFVY